jgi:hypothetical protein
MITITRAPKEPSHGDRHFHASFSTEPHRVNCFERNGSVELVTCDTASHMNVHIRGSATLQPKEAQALRDLLIEAYPLPDATPAPAPAKKSPHGAQKYLGNGAHTWEMVSGAALGVRRLRVPGGWLYRDSYTDTTVFVPMPDVVGYEI